MTFDKLAYIDRLKAAGFAEPQARAMADGLDQALREEVATKSDLGLLKGEMIALKGELLAAMKADKIDFLKWVVMLIVGQTACLHRIEAARPLVGYAANSSHFAAVLLALKGFQPSENFSKLELIPF